MNDRKKPDEEPYELDLGQPEGQGVNEAAREPNQISTAATEASIALGSAMDQLAKLKGEAEDLRSTLVRRQADFDNYRKRVERERTEDSKRAIARVVEELLPVLDAFERALAAHREPTYEEYRKGLELIYRQLWEALAKQGLERIEAEGQRFDPHVHQAVERVESREHEDGAVVEVLQPGYTLRGRLLRPAAVRVAIHPSDKGEEESKATSRRVN